MCHSTRRTRTRFSNLSQLCSVVCSDNYIGGMGAVVLANALKSNTGLCELHVKGNELGDAGTTAICDALAGQRDTV